LGSFSRPEQRLPAARVSPMIPGPMWKPSAEAIALARERHNPGVIGWALRSYAVMLGASQLDEQRAALDEALDMLHRFGLDPAGYAFTLGRLAEAEFLAGELGPALANARRASTLLAEAGKREGHERATLLSDVSAFNVVADPGSARDAVTEAFQSCIRAGESLLAAFVVQHAALEKANAGDAPGAARLFGYGRTRIPAQPRVQFRVHVVVANKVETLLHAQLSDDAFARWAREGEHFPEARIVDALRR
jgi:hypothetical protein